MLVEADAADDMAWGDEGGGGFMSLLLLSLVLSQKVCIEAAVVLVCEGGGGGCMLPWLTDRLAKWVLAIAPTDCCEG